MGSTHLTAITDSLRVEDVVMMRPGDGDG